MFKIYYRYDIEQISSESFMKNDSGWLIWFSEIGSFYE